MSKINIRPLQNRMVNWIENDFEIYILLYRKRWMWLTIHLLEWVLYKEVEHYEDNWLPDIPSFIEFKFLCFTISAK